MDKQLKNNIIVLVIATLLGSIPISIYIIKQNKETDGSLFFAMSVGIFMLIMYLGCSRVKD